LTTFQLESVEKWEAEGKELVYAHWQELGLDLDLEIAPDYAKMKAMEAIGMWKVLTVREDGILKGYTLAVISVHLHYSTSPKMFIVDAYYISPDARKGTGVKMIRSFEALAKELGCIKIYLTCKVHKDHSKLFTALGYKLSDFAFTKRI